MASGFPFNEGLRGAPRSFAPPPRPRAPPRFIRPPTPVLMERPQPLVPDVSLLSIASTNGGGPSFHSNLEEDSSHFDLSSTNPTYHNYVPSPPSLQNNHKNSTRDDDDSGNGSASRTHDSSNLTTDRSLNHSKKSRSSSKSPPPPLSNNQYDSLKTELSSVHSVVNNQTNLIANLSTQFSQMIQMQEKLVAQLTLKNSTKSVHTQTTTDPSPPPQNPKSPPPPKDPQPSKPEVQCQAPNLSRNPSLKRLTTATKSEKSPTNDPITAADISKRTAADFSTVLRNLQISQVQPPSMYSETSGVKSIDCPPFNPEEEDDSIGPSASCQGSDLEGEGDDDPELLPSVTYYNNLITTVNRILDSGPPKKSTPPPSNSSKTHQKIPSKNSSSSSNGSTASYTNYSNNQDDAFKENVHPPPPGGAGSGGPSPVDSVQSTKRYLQSIGVQFDSPSSPQPQPSHKSHPQNYMIQQNVYNSIYIPTVNCVPVGGGGLPDSFNSNSGVLDNLAKKYLPSGERNQYEYDLMQSKRKEPAGLAGGGAETTVYGMSPGNLSFATRDYLQRHGLVDSTTTAPSTHHPQQNAGPPPPPQNHHHPQHHQQALLPRRMSPPQTNFNGNYQQSDKILDMTAIRNQPKLL